MYMILNGEGRLTGYGLYMDTVNMGTVLFPFLS